MDFPKTSDTLDHSLLIAKLEAYGFRDVRCKVGNCLVYGEKLHQASLKVPYLNP